MKFNNTFFPLVMLLFSVLALGGCEKLLERQPPGLTPSEAIQSASDMQEVVNSIYDIMANTYNGSLQNLGELLSDNLSQPVQNEDYTEVWNRLTIFFNGNVGGQFAQLYRIVFRANSVLEAIEVLGDELSQQERQRFEAEARFMRALGHFDAVRLWAQPYNFSTDNSHPGVAIRLQTFPEVLNVRPTVAQVYQQVLEDLLFAEANLPPSNGIYATTWTAKALLSRVYFQMHDYERAASYASEVIDSGFFPLSSDLTFYSWPQSNTEAILMVFSAPRGDNESDNRSGGLRGNYSSLGNTTLRVAAPFFAELTAQGGPKADLFKQVEVDGDVTFVTTMFDEINFHIPLLTTTEMMLTRAEALAYIGANLSPAITDINNIRERSLGTSLFNLPPGANAEDVKEAARRERRFALAFTGDRVQQLKRRGAEGEDIIVRGAPWNCPGMALQMPIVEQTEGFQLNPQGGCN